MDIKGLKLAAKIIRTEFFLTTLFVLIYCLSLSLIFIYVKQSQEGADNEAERSELRLKTNILLPCLREGGREREREIKRRGRWRWRGRGRGREIGREGERDKERSKWWTKQRYNNMTRKNCLKDTKECVG